MSDKRAYWLEILVDDWPGSIRSLARMAGLSHTTILYGLKGTIPISDDTARRLRGACRKVAHDLDVIAAAWSEQLSDDA